MFIKALTNFHNSAEFRTIDIVASIPVMLAQLYVFMQLENYQQYLQESELKLDQRQLQVIFRYALEEELRRKLKQDAQPLEKNMILKVLFPDYKKFVDEVMVHKEKEIRASFSGGSDSGNENNAMNQFKTQADMFRQLDSLRSQPVVTTQDQEESKGDIQAKNSKAAANGATDI